MTARRARLAAVAALPLALAVLAVIPLGISAFGLQLSTLVVIYTLAVVGLDAVAGRGGQLHVGYAVIFAAGAYTMAIVSRELHAPAIVGGVLGVAMGGLLSTVLGLVLARSTGYMFAVLTLAASTAVASIVSNVAWLGGTAGLGGVSRDVVGLGDLSPVALYVLVCVVTAVVVLLYAQFRATATGRAIEAMRTVPAVAQASGVELAHLRVKLSLLSGMIGGAAGVLYAWQQQYVSADIVGATASVNLLAMNIIGGSTVALAGLPGAFITVALPQMFQSLVSYQIILVGVVMGVVALWFRRGVAGTTLDLWWRAAGPVLARQRRRPRAPRAEPIRSRREPRRISAEPGAVLAASSIAVEFDGVVALSDVSIALHAGTIHALVGPNGAGKSTLVNVIAGSRAPTRGQVTLRGRDITRMSPQWRCRAGITRTFQLVSLCATLSVRENVMVGGHVRREASFVRDFMAMGSRRREQSLDRRAEEMLETLEAADLGDRRVAELTSGQQRLAEIARCLMTDADVILLDEPAAGLSTEERGQLANVIRGLARDGRAVLLIEHDMDFVMALAERITVLADGVVLADGNPGAVRDDPRVIEAYWGAAVAA